jgi:hypothetical protein
VRNDQVVSQRVQFRFTTSTDVDVLASDTRTPVAMMDLLLSINRTYLATSMAAEQVYLEEAGRQEGTLPPDATLAGVQMTPKPQTLSEQVSTGMWVGLLAALGVVAAGFLAVSNVVHRRATAVGQLTGSKKQHQSDQKLVTEDDRTNYLAGDEAMPFPLDERRHFAGQGGGTVMEAADDAGMRQEHHNPLARFEAQEQGLRAYVRERVQRRNEADQRQLAAGRGDAVAGAA